MRKKHPVRTFFLLLLTAAMVAGLAAMPRLSAKQEVEDIKVSILSGVPERRSLTRAIYSGAALEVPESKTVSVPAEVLVTEFLVANGDTVRQGDPIARVDDVSVMTAVKAVQDSLDEIGSQLQTAKNKITPGIITVNDEGKLCVNGTQIDDAKLTYYTQYLNLSEQHREYEQLLLDLFRLHQDGVVTAPCDGMVSDLDKTMIAKLSGGAGGKLTFLAANTPAGDDDEVYNGYVRLITGIREDGMWEARTGTTPCIITDFLDTSGVSLVVSDAADICSPETVFVYSGGEWSIAAVTQGDILLYAYASDNTYWVVKIGNVPVTPDPEEPTEPTQPGESETDPTDPSDPSDPTESTDPTEPAQPGENPGADQGGSRPSGGSGSSNWGQISGMVGGGSSGGQQQSSLYGTDTTTLCTVIPMDIMELSLPIDEADIASLQVGLTADITLEALPNRAFSGTVTEISSFGTNSGGSSKFTVTVELPWEEDMLPGMNASVTIPLETMDDCLTVPVAALTEQGSKTVMYTALDEKTGEPTAPVTVELGFSDGEYAQLLSGIEEGGSFHYKYYDVLEIDTSVETIGMFG